MSELSPTAPLVSVIHATRAAMPPIDEALTALSGVRVLHQLDEALLWEVDRRGGMTREGVQRMTDQLRLAEQAASDAVLTTCNAYSLVIIEELRPHFPRLPIVVIDEPMILRAIAFDRVAVLATVPAGLESQRDLLVALARRRGRAIHVAEVLEPSAFAALTAGHPQEHDQILLGRIRELIAEHEVIMLAQASMARLVPLLAPEWAGRVLSSPDLAVQAVASSLGLGSKPGVSSGVG